MALRVLIADDHGVVAEGLRLVVEAQPDMEVIACVQDSREAVRCSIEGRPDVVLIDHAMPLLNGAEAARLQGLVVAVEGWGTARIDAALAALQPSRMAAPGSLHLAPLAWPQDHRPPFASLLLAAGEHEEAESCLAAARARHWSRVMPRYPNTPKKKAVTAKSNANKPGTEALKFRLPVMTQSKPNPAA